MANVVFFDIGSTLLYPDPGVPEAFAIAARRRGHQLETSDVEPFISEMNDYYEAQYQLDGDFWCSREGCKQIWIDQYLLLAERVGLAHDGIGIAEDLYNDYYSPSYWRYYDDVKPALSALKKAGYRLGVISNWSDQLESLLRGLELLPYFDDIMASGAVGYRKPNPVMFQLAMERMGVGPEDCAHVGDHLEADGAGAANVSIRPIIIDRKNQNSNCGFDHVTSLTQILDILQ